MDRDIKILEIKSDSNLKNYVLDYIENCDWNVKHFFQEQLEMGFKRDSLPYSYALISENNIIGFFQILDYEPIKNNSLTPWISTIFVDKKYRGSRLSELMINHAKKQIKKLGYNSVYISTDHIGLYEKMGFIEIGLGIDKWGYPTKIYKQDL